MFARHSLKQKRPNTFQNVVIWNNGHSWCAGLRLCPPFFIFLCFNVHLPAKILSGFDVEAFFFFLYMLWLLETVEKLARSEIHGHLLNFTFIFPNTRSWCIVAFPFSDNMRLWFGLTRPCLMTETSQTWVATTCYSALAFNWARFMIHANVRNAKRNVYWR